MLKAAVRQARSRRPRRGALRIASGRSAASALRAVARGRSSRASARVARQLDDRRASAFASPAARRCRCRAPDRLGNPVHRTRDDRQDRRHRFEQRDRQSLRVRRQQQQIGVGEAGGDLRGVLRSPTKLQVRRERRAAHARRFEVLGVLADEHEAHVRIGGDDVGRGARGCRSRPCAAARCVPTKSTRVPARRGRSAARAKRRTSTQLRTTSSRSGRTPVGEPALPAVRQHDHAIGRAQRAHENRAPQRRAVRARPRRRGRVRAAARDPAAARLARHPRARARSRSRARCGGGRGRDARVRARLAKGQRACRALSSETDAVEAEAARERGVEAARRAALRSGRRSVAHREDARTRRRRAASLSTIVWITDAMPPTGGGVGPVDQHARQASLMRAARRGARARTSAGSRAGTRAASSRRLRADARPRAAARRPPGRRGPPRASRAGAR